MRHWTGLGMTYNYNGAGADPTVDLPIIKAQGFTKIRLLMVDYIDPTKQGVWRGIASQALALGFYVIYGPTAIFTGITSTNWTDFATAVKTEAANAQALNNVNLEFQIGNEEESHHDGSISDATIRNNLLTLATDVQAIYTVGKVSYSVADNSVDAWIALGKGDLDYLGFNLYNYLTDFKAKTASIFTTFGVNAFISEFGPNAGGTANGGMDLVQWAARFETELDIITRSGLPSAYLYTFMDAANVFGIKNTNGTYEPYYGNLIAGLLPIKEVLIDGFATTVNGQLWDDGTTGHGVITSGQLVMTSLLGGAYYTLTSHDKYDLVNSQHTIQLIDAGNQTLTSWEVYPIIVKLDTNNSAGFKLTGGNIITYKTVGGVESDTTTVYNSSIHKYFRIKESLGTMTWDYSTDGITWSNLRSVITPFDVSWIQVIVMIGTWQAEATTTNAIFDNMNIPILTPPKHAVTILRTIAARTIAAGKIVSTDRIVI